MEGGKEILEKIVEVDSIFSEGEYIYLHGRNKLNPSQSEDLIDFICFKFQVNFTDSKLELVGGFKFVMNFYLDPTTIITDGHFILFCQAYQNYLLQDIQNTNNFALHQIATPTTITSLATPCFLDKKAKILWVVDRKKLLKVKVNLYEPNPTSFVQITNSFISSYFQNKITIPPPSPDPKATSSAAKALPPPPPQPITVEPASGIKQTEENPPLDPAESQRIKESIELILGEKQASELMNDKKPLTNYLSSIFILAKLNFMVQVSDWAFYIGSNFNEIIQLLTKILTFFTERFIESTKNWRFSSENEKEMENFEDLKMNLFSIFIVLRLIKENLKFQSQKIFSMEAEKDEDKGDEKSEENIDNKTEELQKANEFPTTEFSKDFLGLIDKLIAYSLQFTSQTDSLQFCYRCF